MEGSNRDQGPGRGDLIALGAIALGMVVLHTITNGQYGLHRDELQVLDDARHLDWGFVAYPPFTPVVERVSMALFGTSLAGLRLFSAMAQGLVIFLGGRMARELGGKRFAQVLAALAVAVAPLVIFEGTEFQYSSFDLLWWVLIAYFLIRLFKSDNPRWWVAVGTVIGLGLVTKYSAVFFVAGIVGGVLLTRARRYLINPWLWCGVGAALIVFLPNLIWQIRHHFVAVDFLRHIHSRDVSIGRTAGFVKDQFLVCTNPFSVPIWLAGLYFYLFEKNGSRYRMLGWAYLITFAIFLVAKGRGYYLGPAYPMLFATGAVMEEQWVLSLATKWPRILRVATFAALAAGGAAAAAIIVPILPVDSPKNIAIKVNGDLKEEIGWKELVGTVAEIRDSLSPAEQAHLGILAANYGEAGAIDYYGPAYGLPIAISGVNSIWQRGYGEPPPKTLIVLGLSRRFVESHFQGCRVAGHSTNPYGIKNEETSEHPDIYVCGPPLKPWPEFWKGFQYFG